MESYWVSDRHNLARFECEQPPYSIFVRGIEKEALPVCAKYGTGVIPWSPLNRGWLASTARARTSTPSRALPKEINSPIAPIR